jgi:hypothetical protein
MIPTNPGMVATLLIGSKLVLPFWLPTSNKLNGLDVLERIDRLSE